MLLNSCESSHKSKQVSEGRIHNEVPIIDSYHILQGKKVVVIEHENKTYQLRVTKENKLILTK